jgi:hypothetical protein
LISIVSPRTFLRWLNAEGRRRPQRAGPTRSSRPRTAEAIRELVLRLAHENDWGYKRILGELKKLGVRKICRSTVVNILRDAGQFGPQFDAVFAAEGVFRETHHACFAESECASRTLGTNSETGIAGPLRGIRRSTLALFALRVLESLSRNPTASSVGQRAAVRAAFSG